MFPYPQKSFVHPRSVYKLEYPSHWDQLIEKEGASCGFGPHDRDDVGLWISIMPVSVDTEKLQEALPGLMQQVLDRSGGENLRKDPTLQDHGLIADITKDGEGGHYWILTGGDVVLFASSQVPAAERDVWNPLFGQVMASLLITRDDQLLLRQAANELLAQLRKQHPDQDFHFEGDKIEGREQVVFLNNVLREVKAYPSKRDKIIKDFIEKLSQPPPEMGQEVWDDVRDLIVPILKHKEYVDREGPTKHLLATRWLAAVVIVYAIRRKNLFRFVTGWDVDRWGLTAEVVHDRALANLAHLPWPKQMMGSRTKDATGRVIVVDTDDNLASSRLLHPELHRIFSGPLGRTFMAGIPCRDRLVLYSDRRELKKRIGRKLKKDHDGSAYPITPRPFQVTPDGIAPATEK